MMISCDIINTYQPTGNYIMSNFKTKVQTKTKRVVKNAVTTSKMKKAAANSSDYDFYLAEGEASYVARASGIYDSYRSTVGRDNDWN
jgi:hypothetical protein